MLYDIACRISYDYAGPSAVARHVLRLMPLDLPGEQRLVAGSVAIEPAPAFREDWRDFFGNPCVTVGHSDAHTQVAFRLTARVERQGAPSSFDIAPSLDRLIQEIESHRSLAPGAPHHFLGTSPRVRPERAMTDYARAQLTPTLTALGCVQAIGQALHRDMRFDAGTTTVDTAPAEAFARRHGVCQDFTHIMIACLRGIGIPAGYVSGFLRTEPPPGQPRLEGADAMHAWVRAWCGVETGWVEFDPTNDVIAGADHVVVARGRDYSDVSPVRGVLRSVGTHTTEQAVDMIPL